MTIKPEISVVITVRNGEKHIRDAVQSILDQTYQLWSLIICDDGSVDLTGELCKLLSSSDSRIKLLTLPPVGRSKALNIGCRICESKWITILDCDDVFHSRKLELHANYLRLLDERYISSTSITTFADSRPIKWPRELYVGKYTDVTDRLVVRNPLAHSGAIFARSTFDLIGGYSESMRGAVDYDFYVRAVVAGRRLVKIPIPLVARRIHDEQSFEARRRVKYLAMGYGVQLRAIRALDGSAWCYLIAVARFVYGLLPRWLRGLAY